MAKGKGNLKPVDVFEKNGLRETWYIDAKERSHLKRKGLCVSYFYNGNLNDWTYLPMDGDEPPIASARETARDEGCACLFRKTVDPKTSMPTLKILGVFKRLD